MRLVKLAREIAMDIQPIEKILVMLNIGSDEYQSISGTPAFQRILGQQMEEWNGAANTAERVRLKCQSAVEEALPEFFGQMHEKSQPLSSKVEVLKTLGKYAGLEKQVGEVTSGEKVSVIINLGGGDTIKVEQTLPAQVIDHQPTPVRELNVFEINSELA